MEHPPNEHKDWTWVLETRCEQCGLDAQTVERSQLGGLVRANAGAWRTLLSRGNVVSQRPPVPAGAPPVWSAVEYGCHVRDVYRLGTERVTRMLKKKSPRFVDWDQDRAAIEENYANAEVDPLIYALAVNAGSFADLIDKVRGDQWDRTGERSDGVVFTVESLIRYFYHDAHHHLWDANQGIEAILEARKAEARRLAGETDEAAEGS